MKCVILYKNPTKEEIKAYSNVITSGEVVAKVLTALYFILIIGILWGLGMGSDDELSSSIILGIALFIYDIKHIRRAIKCHRQYQCFTKGKYKVSEIDMDDARFVYKGIGRERSVLMDNCYVCAYAVPHIEHNAVMVKGSYVRIYNEKRATLIKLSVGRKDIYYIAQVIS